MMTSLQRSPLFHTPSWSAVLELFPEDFVTEIKGIKIDDKKNIRIKVEDDGGGRVGAKHMKK